MNNRLENHTVSEPGQQEIDAVRALFNAGRYAQAAPLARSMTERFPLCAFGWKALAATYTQLGLIAEALAPSQKLAALLPDDADAHFNLGFVLHELGRPDEAEASYRRALQIGPDYAEVHFNLGNLLNITGRLMDAEAAYLRALELTPDHAEAHFNLGNALHRQGRVAAAAAAYRRALSFKPDYIDALNNLGHSLRHLGQPDAALACFDRLIALRPGSAEAYNSRGNVLHELKQAEAALASYDRAIALRPDYADACNNRGNVLHELEQPEAALASYERAIALNPDYLEANINRGAVLLELDQPDAALACYDRAIAIKPDHAGACYNRGVVLHERKQLDAALASYDRAIALQPDLADAHWNRALLHLLTGDFEQGWAGHEWRWSTVQLIGARRNFPQPQWKGEAAEGLTLLIHAEQGYGDTLQFCRYAPLAAARGLRVILEAPPPLVRLLGSLPGVDLIIREGEALPAFDLHCPMLSLPLALGTTLSTVPAHVPYLHADPEQVAAWRTRLAALPDQGIRVGLVWAGNPRVHSPKLTAVDRRRSMNPERLAPLFDLPGFHFFSLQKDGVPAPEHFPLTDFMAEMQDFADTAALVANLDLVISVDTSVVHLAAALGKPVWVLDRFDSCWRWLLDRDDSPWYPGVKLYRQQKPGDWDGVLARVKADLRGLIK